MKQLFITGAGFSKAISPQMPTLWELSENGMNWEELPFKPQAYKDLRTDIEQFLTYLYQEMPWKSQEEIHLDRAAFIAITRQIGAYIKLCENNGLSENVPKWGMAFAKYLHRQQACVATLNYDTIIETLWTWIDSARTTDEYSIYRLPIVNLAKRLAYSAILGNPPIESFRLLKLHGSVSWFTTNGDSQNFTNEVYYKSAKRLCPVYPDGERKIVYVRNGSSLSPKWEDPIGFEYKGPNNSDAQDYNLDLVPLIIPPVADKSTFYKMRLVKVLWNEFREAIRQAEEIYCIGYSLPKTDLTMRLFLRSLSDTEDKKVFLVNNAEGAAADELIQNYRDVFRNCQLDQTFLGKGNAVQKMVECLCSPEDWPPPVENKH